MQIPEGVDLIEFTNNYIKAHGLNKTLFSDLLTGSGTSRPYVSRYLNRTYDSDPTTIENAIIDYFQGLPDETETESADDVIAESVTAPPMQKPHKTGTVPLFFKNKDSKSVVAVCQACQDNTGLGIVVGKSGFGKSHALLEYSKKDRVFYLECEDCMNCRDLVEGLEQCIGRPKGSGSIWKRVQGIKDFFKTRPGCLLIIDETDKLMDKFDSKPDLKKMEVLRTLFKNCKAGIVVAGEPALEGMIKMYLPQFANLFDFYYKMCGLSQTEVDEYLSEIDFTTEALKEISSRALNEQTGCFRLLNRTLTNLKHVFSSTNKVTLQDIQNASSLMML